MVLKTVKLLVQPDGPYCDDTCPLMHVSYEYTTCPLADYDDLRSKNGRHIRPQRCIDEVVEEDI